MNKVEEGDIVSITIPTWMAKSNDLDVDEDAGGGDPYDVKGRIKGESEKAYQLQIKEKDEPIWPAKSQIMHIEVLEGEDESEYGGGSDDQDWDYDHTKYDISTSIEIIKHSKLDMSMFPELVEQLEAYRKGDDEEKIQAFYQTIHGLKEGEEE